MVGPSLQYPPHINCPFMRRGVPRPPHAHSPHPFPNRCAQPPAPPFVEGKWGTSSTWRLSTTATTAARIQSPITERVIPEELQPLSTAEYGGKNPPEHVMPTSIEPHDPENILRGRVALFFPQKNAAGHICQTLSASNHAEIPHSSTSRKTLPPVPPPPTCPRCSSSSPILKALVNETLSPLKAQEDPLGCRLDRHLSAKTSSPAATPWFQTNHPPGPIHAFGLADTPFATAQRYFLCATSSSRVATPAHSLAVPALEKIPPERPPLPARILRALPKDPHAPPYTTFTTDRRLAPQTVNF